MGINQEWINGYTGNRITRMHRSMNDGRTIVIRAERHNLPDKADNAWSVTLNVYRTGDDMAGKPGYGEAVTVYAALPYYLTPAQVRRYCDKMAPGMQDDILARAEEAAYDEAFQRHHSEQAQLAVWGRRHGMCDHEPTRVALRDCDHGQANLDPRQAVTWHQWPSGAWQGLGLGGRLQLTVIGRDAWIDVYASDPQGIGAREAAELIVDSLHVAIPTDVTDRCRYLAGIAMLHVHRLVAARQFELYPLTGVWAA